MEYTGLRISQQEAEEEMEQGNVYIFIKGKSAIARQFGGRDRNFTGEHFWARGYAVSTVGFELEQVRAYIRDQEAADDQGRF